MRAQILYILTASPLFARFSSSIGLIYFLNKSKLWHLSDTLKAVPAGDSPPSSAGL
jgi:hypothetical protein